MKTILAAAVMAASSAGVPAFSQDLGGPSLLNAGREAQLESWLGAGDMAFSHLFTGVPGNTSLDFHSAADGKGPTFTLMQVSNALGQSYLVGGYNPQSWSSSDGWHVTVPDWQRTAFIFNMTEPAVYRQVPSDYILPSQGSRQTYNAPDHGPTFGAGADLFVNDRLDTSFSWRLTYGDPAGEGKSIFDGSTGGQFFHIDALQLYAVSPVPEPATAGMLAAGLAAIGALARRRQRARR